MTASKLRERPFLILEYSSCRTWSWVYYWGKGNEKTKSLWNLLTGMDGLVGYLRSVWTRNLPWCMQWKQVELFCNEWWKHDVHTILEKSCVQWTLASPVECGHGWTVEEIGNEKTKSFWKLLTGMAWLGTWYQYGQGICRGAFNESRWNSFAMSEESMMSTIILRIPVCNEGWRVLDGPDRGDRSTEEDLDKGQPCC